MQGLRMLIISYEKVAVLEKQESGQAWVRCELNSRSMVKSDEEWQVAFLLSKEFKKAVDDYDNSYFQTGSKSVGRSLRKPVSFKWIEWASRFGKGNCLSYRLRWCREQGAKL